MLVGDYPLHSYWIICFIYANNSLPLIHSIIARPHLWFIDTWLRRRDGKLQLKYSPADRVESSVHQYKESEDVNFIRQYVCGVFNKSLAGNDVKSMKTPDKGGLEIIQTRPLSSITVKQALINNKSHLWYRIFMYVSRPVYSSPIKIFIHTCRQNHSAFDVGPFQYYICFNSEELFPL